MHWNKTTKKKKTLRIDSSLRFAAQIFTECLQKYLAKLKYDFNKQKGEIIIAQKGLDGGRAAAGEIRERKTTSHDSFSFNQFPIKESRGRKSVN